MEKLYKEMNNAEIRKISYEECPLKCTGCKALCNEMPVGQCRKNLSQAFDNKDLSEVKMNKYDIDVILQPKHKKYNGRRYLKMEHIEADSREEAIEKVKGYMQGMLQDYVTLIIE